MLVRVPSSSDAEQGLAVKRRNRLRSLAVIALFALVTVASPNVGRASAAEDCNDGQGQVAIRGCTELIKSGKLTPENLATAYLNRAIAFANEGKLAKARQDLDHSIELSPSDPLLFYNRGNIAIDLNELESAVSDFTSAIALDPSFALAYLNRGLAEEALGQLAASIEDYRSALALDKSLSAASEGLKRLEPEPRNSNSGS